MKPLSRLAGLSTALLVTVVALSGTAHAKLPSPDPETVSPVAFEAPPSTVVIESGLSVLQVVALMLLAAIAAAVVTTVAGRHLPRIHGTRHHTSASAGAAS
ncbi:hypothetical protein [Kribbella shirazensis]|uniref:Uncharacterized protein n=1 Tax=Kribbella shirazensis TaxID=1105143 RepID=A0A7X5V877_9ACTN|nr:hypothetical protein [Kribbella shirazensis]NIK56367.1 hypothetical protein [Kribbella shirazensis]